jgi:hypothetical protein
MAEISKTERIFFCPKCGSRMNKKGTTNFAVPSGTIAGTATISQVAVSGSSVFQSWEVYYCPNCKYECNLNMRS